MKMLRIVALLVLFAPGVALAQEYRMVACSVDDPSLEVPVRMPAPEESKWASFGDYWKACEEAERAKEAEQERRRQEARALIASIEAMQRANEQEEQRAETEAARKAAADAQLQAHMQQVAARKSQEWQNQLWLWEAQRQSQAQQQYQQQLLHQLRSDQVRRQWFRRDLVRAVESLAPPTCHWSFTKQRNVCY